MPGDRCPALGKVADMEAKPTTEPVGSETKVDERDLPRVCRSCRAPVARDAVRCCRCGAPWASAAGPGATVTVLAARSASEARPDADGWTNDGGTLGVSRRP